MNKTFKQILILTCLVIILILPYFVFASEAANKLKLVGEKGYAAGATESSFSEILGTVVKAALSLLGVIFIILMLYAGYGWMTASGNEEKVTKAKETIWRAIIGIIITVGAYAIWYFVLTKFINTN